MTTKYFECMCSEMDHTLRIRYDEDEADFLYVELHMRQFSFFKRLWLAMKYVVGIRSKYGDFDEFVWDHKIANEFGQVIEDYLKDNKKLNND